MTTNDITSYKALNVEVCIESESFGQLWLVPRYTGQDRLELTPEHVATICILLSLLPGCRVIAFNKITKGKKR